MEASQRRINPTRISEPEQSLPKQLLPSVGDGNVRELPQRLLSVAQPTPPPVKQKTQTRGNRASRKSKLPLWKHWVTYSQLREDKTRELKLLNDQFLAEQTALQYEARSPRPIFELDPSKMPSTMSHALSQPEVQTSVLQDEEADRLQVKMAHVRQIVSDFGAAIAEGENLSEGKGLTHSLIPTESQWIPSPVIESEAPKVLHSRRANPGLAEQEAAQTAAQLRHLAEKARSTPSQRPTANLPAADLPNPDLQLSREFIQSQNQEALRVKRSRKRRKFQLRNLLQLPQRPLDRGVDAVIWIAFAGVVRVGVRFLLMAVPALSPVAIGLMLLPIAIGIFLLLFAPKAGYLPVYRLFLITLGLLLGGNL